MLRRAVDRPLLSTIKFFDSPGFTRPIFPGTHARFTSIDTVHAQLWFTLLGSYTGSDGVERLTSAAIINGVIGDEITARERTITPSTPAESRYFVRAFAYDSVNGTFLHAYQNFEAHQSRLIQSNIAGDEQTLLQGTAPPLYIDGVTALSPDLPSRYKQLLPAVAHEEGKNGTRWRSDVWMFNPSVAEMTFTMRRVSAPSVERSITLQPKASMKLQDVLDDFGFGATLDALVFDAPYRPGAQLSVYSRAYTAAPDGGTYGQAVPAVPLPDGYSNHIDSIGYLDMAESEAALLVLDKRDPARFRHNLGVVNTGDDPITLTLRYGLVSPYAPSNPAQEVKVLAAPHSVRVVPIETVFPAEVIANWPPRIQIIGDHPAPLWMSMVDNITGDASFVPFSVYSIEAPLASRLAVPAIAHATDAEGREWRTTLYGNFASSGQQGFKIQEPQAVFYPSSDGCDTKAMQLVPSYGAMLPGTPVLQLTTEFLDIGGQLCDSQNVRGTVEVNSGSWTSAFARTYTVARNGGTFGEVMPMFPPRGWPARHFPGIEVRDEVSVKIGLYNGFETAGTIELRLYDAAGALALTRQITLAPKQSIEKPLREIFGDIHSGLYALSVVPIDVAGCWPYVSTIDNVTGDPTNWW